MPAATTTTLSPSAPLHGLLIRLRNAWHAFAQERANARSGTIHSPVWNPWQIFWGEAYGLDLKRWLLKPVFENLEQEGKIGGLIVDVGSGAQPVTRFIQALPGRKRIFVDIAADNTGTGDEQKIRMDVEKAGEPAALSFRKAIVRVCRFLDVAPGRSGPAKGADMMVFADLLNYVDFRKVLRGFGNYLKPGGRMVIVNLPMRGNQSLFSDKGLKDNRELYEFLQEQRFEIEHKSFPCRDPKATDEAEELIVLVARKAA